MNRLHTVGAIVAPTMMMISGLSSANDAPFYTDDFEQQRPRPEWTHNLVIEGNGPPIFSRFAGRYTNQTVRLTLDAPEFPGDSGDGGGGHEGGGDEPGGGDRGDHVAYRLLFDFYAIDSWDGSNSLFGPDTFEVGVNGETLLSEFVPSESDAGPFGSPDVGPDYLGFSGGWKDRIFRDVSVEFELDPGVETLLIDFRGVGLQVRQDESWGIDNVRFSGQFVPAPATAGVLGSGLLLLSRRRRDTDRQ